MSKKNKYKVEYIMGIANRISVSTDVDGYTIGVLEPFFPTAEEVEDWTTKQHIEWTKQNNKRLRAICNFLNRSNGL